jgi:hypothetical protein
MHILRIYLLALLLTIACGAAFGQSTGTNGGGFGPYPVIVVSPSSNQCLVFNGTAWTNQTCAGGSGTVDMANVVQTGGETWPLGYLQATSVTNNTSTYAFGSGDNGNLIAEQSHSGSCNSTLPQIGTAGLNGNGWQSAFANYGTITCALTPATSTINNGTVTYVGQYGFALMFPDANSPGNYNALVGGGCTFASNGTCTWPNDLKAPVYIVNGNGATGIGGQAWFGQQASSGPCLGYGTACGLWVNTNLNTDVAGLQIAKGTPPSLTCSTSSATCTQSSTAGLAITSFSGTSIAATSVPFVPNEAGQFTTTGTLPTGLALATTYYVNVTGLSTSGFQVCAAAMAIPTVWTTGSSPWTACTSISTSGGSGTATFTPIGNSNYIVYGNAQRGVFQLPVGTFTAAALFLLAWPSDSDITLGIQCQGYDLTQNTQLVNPAFTLTSSSLEKATAATALDFFTYNCGGV